LEDTKSSLGAGGSAGLFEVSLALLISIKHIKQQSQEHVPELHPCLAPGQSLQMRGTPEIRKQVKERQLFFRGRCNQTCGVLRFRMSLEPS
jgi:hypothetical protein